MNTKYLKRILLLIILLMASFLRLWRLGSYPAFNADEAAIGYNAYSLIETGLDEHGNAWPLHFQSFNDFKPGLYFYLVLPFVKFMGLNEWSVRLPNALLGIASVYLLYLLMRLYTKNATDDKYYLLELIPPALLAISPWHIHFSRGGWEANTSTFLLLSGFLCFLKFSSDRKYRFIYLSVVSLVLSMYTYHSARLIAPLMGLSFLIFSRNGFRENIKLFLSLGAFAIMISIPLGFSLVKGGVYSRVAGVGIFSDPGPLLRVNEQRGQHVDFSGIIPVVLHNKYIGYSLAFVNNWAKHFHGEFLFLSGDEIQRSKVPETGQLYTFEFLTIAIGLLFVMYKWNGNGYGRMFWKLILFWLIISPVPAALTFQSPHALRAQNMVIPLTVISGYGLFMLIKAISNLKPSLRLLSQIVLSAIIAISFLRYFHMYFVHMSKEYPYSSQYGVKELVSFLGSVDIPAEKIVVTTEYDQPYILFLFYMKYSPREFQKDHVLSARDKYGFSTVESFSKFIFKPINWDSDKLIYRNSMIIGTPDEIPIEANIIKKIYGSNGYEYFRVVVN